MFIKTDDTKCSKCRFFDAHPSIKDVSLGFCKRYPPQFVQAYETYPKVDRDNWCGEFRKLYKFDPHDVMSDGYKE
jgi:hypothetical protein